jgi:hypothetical protein
MVEELSLFAHVFGLPLEEAAAQLVPVTVALVLALRVSVRRLTTGRARDPKEEV